MAARIEQFDWATTSLGPRDRWPASLRTAVGLCLASPVPSLVWWGPDQINIYNDAHAPQLADRHPAALGMPARDVWSAVWDVVGPRVEAVMKRGESIVRERERLVMKRAGFPDVMYYTFTLSPIPDDRGGIGGIFQIAMDETARVVTEIVSRQAQARAEDALRLASVEAERRLAHWRSVVAHMAEGVILVDMDGTMLDWNRAALDMHGNPSAESRGANLFDLRAMFNVYDLHGAFVPFEEWPFARLLRGDRVRNMELRVHRVGIRPDLMLVYNGTLIRDENGQPRLAMMSLHDATERHRVERAAVAGVRPNRRFAEFDAASADVSLSEDERDERSAAKAATTAESLLERMHLTPKEREFCASLGQHLVQNAIDTYLMTNQHTKEYDGSCIAASLAVAMIIVQDL